MNDKNTAGIDLDKLSADIMNLPCKAGRAIAMNGASMQAYKEGHRDARHAAVELLARRAEPSVAADERALYDHWWHEGPHPFRDISKRKNCQLNEETAWMVWQAACAALASPATCQPTAFTSQPSGAICQPEGIASPAVSQMDGAAVDAYAVARAVRDACLKVSADFRFPETMRAAEALFKVRGLTSSLNLADIIAACQPAATTASAPQVCYGATRADQRCPCAECGIEQATTASASVNSRRLTDAQLSDPGYMRAYVEELKAIIAELAGRRTTAPSRDAAPDVRAGFEKWMTDRGEAVNYAGDGMYEYHAVNLQADAFRAGVEFAALARAPLPVQGDDLAGDLAWHKEALKRHVAKLEAVWEGIREAVQKYTGKPCEGEPFSRLDELLSRLAAPAQEGDARDAARYRWLRHAINRDDTWPSDVANAVTGEELEAAIDAVMSASQDPTQEAE